MRGSLFQLRGLDKPWASDFFQKSLAQLFFSFLKKMNEAEFKSLNPLSSFLVQNELARAFISLLLSRRCLSSYRICRSHMCKRSNRPTCTLHTSSYQPSCPHDVDKRLHQRVGDGTNGSLSASKLRSKRGRGH
jgi:hypothetical protein